MMSGQMITRPSSGAVKPSSQSINRAPLCIEAQLLQPKRFPKHMKQQVPHQVFREGRRSNYKSNFYYDDATFAIKVLKPCWLTGNQLEAARKMILRYQRRSRKGQPQNVWVRVMPGHPRTARAAETRMGGGKGGFDHWVAPVVAHTVIFEVQGLDAAQHARAFVRATQKLPVPCEMMVVKNRAKDLNLNHKEEVVERDDSDRWGFFV